MKFQLSNQSPTIQGETCLVLPILKNDLGTAATQALNSSTDNSLQNIMQQYNFSSKIGSTLFLPAKANNQNHMLLIGCGTQKKLNIDKFRTLVASSINALTSYKIHSAKIFLTELNVPALDSYLLVRHATEAAYDVAYKFDAFKSKHKRQVLPQEITFCNTTSSDFIKQLVAIQHATATAHAKFLVQDLCNTPPNICNPDYMTKKAEEIAENLHLTYEMLPESKLATMGMGSFCSVAQGSKNRGNLTVLQYHGDPDKNAKPIILVGKGITFDTGGYSLKPRQSMLNMKFDMTGSAICLAAIKACAELKLPINVVVVLALAENMCSSTASRPDDIVTSLSGKTIEINNTDAEGRLVLADAITYAQRYHPKVLIDIATLTGACLVALGTELSALFTNNGKLATALKNAATKSGDGVWRLPLLEKYNKELQQSVADLKNTLMKPDAGSIVGACFISNFIGKHAWAHLDIAGTAYEAQDHATYATGRPIQLLIQYLLDASQV